MESILKTRSKIGYLLALVSFIVALMYNSIDSGIVTNVIEYNLEYTYQILPLDQTLVKLTVSIKNNGLRSLQKTKISLMCLSNSIITLNSADTSGLSIYRDNTGYFLNKTFILNGEIYPNDVVDFNFHLISQDNGINFQDIKVSVSSENTTGFYTKEIDYVSSKINFSKLDLYTKGTGIVIKAFLLKIIIPIFIIVVVLFIVLKLLYKIKFIKTLFDWILEK